MATDNEFLGRTGTEQLVATVKNLLTGKLDKGCTADEVGADEAGTAASLISSHNTSEDAHSDIRQMIGEKVYTQKDEPVDAVVGSLWIDTDEVGGDVNSADAVLFTEQTLTEEQKAQARANIAAVSETQSKDYVDAGNPDRHSEYFTITEDGILSLKPEYRGGSTKTAYLYSISDMGAGIVGSKNKELPKVLVIPEIVNETTVHSLAQAIFCTNLAVESVVLPYTINEIPERCFDGANNLNNVYNTENIKVIGKCAFQSTSIWRLKCPELEQISDISTFQKCGRLVYADIGKVTTLPNKTFNECVRLNMVKSQNNITTVGEQCFSLTANLKHADFIPNLTQIGKTGFLCSGIDYDWSKLSNCSFGTDATPLQYNPTDFWSSCTATPCENSLPTFLSQSDDRWTNRNIGTTGITYTDGYSLMCIMHIYCGLHNISLSSVTEFEDIVNEINPNLLNTFTKSVNDIKRFAEGLGLTVEQYSAYNQAVLQTLYDALAAGKYAIIMLTGKSTSLGHGLVAYGINDNGDILLADSIARAKDNLREPTRYALSYDKLCGETYDNNYILNIISL